MQGSLYVGVLTVHACKIIQAYLCHPNEQQATESFQFYWYYIQLVIKFHLCNTPSVKEPNIASLKEHVVCCVMPIPVTHPQQLLTDCKIHCIYSLEPTSNNRDTSAIAVL